MAQKLKELDNVTDQWPLLVSAESSGIKTESTFVCNISQTVLQFEIDNSPKLTDPTDRFKEKEEEEDEEAIRLKNSCCKRYFGPVKKGSLRAAQFVLIQAAIGAGVLALPSLLKQNGIIVGCSFLVLGGIISYISMRILMWASFKTKIVNYNELIEHCFGHKAKIYLEFIYIIFSLGVVVTYNVLSFLQLLFQQSFIVSQFIPDAMKDFKIDSDYYDPAPYARLIQIIILNVFLFFIFLIRDLSSLSFFSLIGFASVVYTIFLIDGQAPSFRNKLCEGQDLKLSHFSLATVQAFAVSIFAYMCHTTIFLFRQEIKRPTMRRMNKVFSQNLFVRAVSTEVILYLMMAVGGYVGLCDTTPDIIIRRDNLNEGTDYLILIARTLFPLYLSVGIPLNASPLRKQIAQLLGKKEPTTKLFHVFWTFVILAIGATLAFEFPQIINIISFLGGMCCTSLVIMFPGMVYVNLCGYKWSNPKKFLMAGVTALLTLTGYFAAVLSLLDIMNIIDLKSM